MAVALSIVNYEGRAEDVDSPVFESGLGLGPSGAVDKGCALADVGSRKGASESSTADKWDAGDASESGGDDEYCGGGVVSPDGGNPPPPLFCHIFR